MLSLPFQIVLLFFAAAASTAVLLPVIIKLAKKFKFVSEIDFRRKNTKPVPLMGGVAIFITVTAFAYAFNMHSIYLVLLCGAPVFIVGVLDDVYQFSAKPRAVIHLLSIAAWLYLVPVEAIVLSRVGLPDVLVYGLCAFWLMGIINSLNMIDGMDGEAGGFSVVVALGMAVIIGINVESMPLVVLAGACAGFLIYNWPPAKVYLGDAGSTFLGFALGTVALTLPMEGTALGLILVPLFLFSFPEVDAVLAMIRRKRGKTSMFRGDHDHIHHKLRKLGLSVPQCLLVIYSAVLYSFMTALTIQLTSDQPVKWLVALLSTFGLTSLLGGIYLLEFRQAHQVSRVSRSILHRYLTISEDCSLQPDNFRASVYDLMPYYKELQQRGIAEVDEFVISFSNYMETNHKQACFFVVGSYSVIALEELGQGLTMEWKAQLATNFQELLEHHRVVKNDQGLPWGLSFYSSRSKGEVFLRKFGLQDKVKEQQEKASAA